MSEEAVRDLIVLVADGTMKEAVSSLLSRHQALDILHPLSSQILSHQHRDPGCRINGVEFLSPFIKQYKHALLMFDYEGCGENANSSGELETILQKELAESGWGDRSSVIILEPELEIWVWSDSPHVETILGWSGREPRLRSWLLEKGFLEQEQIKPSRPKEAMEAALREVRKPRSSALYSKLAQTVGFGRCTDSAFLKFKSILSKWFSNK